MTKKEKQKEKEFWDFIRGLKECSDTPLTPVEARHEQCDFVEKVLQEFFPEKDGYTITSERPDEYHASGTISVEGHALEFTDTIWLSRVCEFADNSEVYPLLNGNIRMSFMFLGMAKKEEE